MISSRPSRLALLLAALFAAAPLLGIAPSSLQDVAAADGGVSAPLRVRSDTSIFTWRPNPGEAQPSNVSIIGEWDWSTHTNLSLNSSTGVWSTGLNLSEGLYCYKFVIGESDYRLDPENAYRGYCGTFENSVARVANHTLSTFTLERDATTGLPSRILLHSGSDGSTLLTGGPQFVGGYHLGATTYNQTSEAWDLDLTVLPDGKHTIHVTGVDSDGDDAEDLLIPFWIGPERNFTWDDALIYMVMTDRFVNGDPTNDMPNGSAAVGADWMGGDFAGVTQMIASGHFADLGVDAIWLTPFNTAANTTGTAADGGHEVSGFHGYWPIRAREVEPRLGTAQNLSDLVDAAHSAGIRVIGDFVVNHVHEDHPYHSDHPDWFNQGCLCGTTDCDWTEHRLDCLFRPYMPDIDWKNRNASEQIIDDAIWWMETFDLDGARIDAVKHVDDLAITNLATRINERFEVAGVDHYLKGETAMGWAGDDLASNANEYGTINRYIGPNSLDGQADFVLYHAVVDNVFTKHAVGDSDARGYQHLDYWTARSQDQYVEGANMVPFIGSHDSPRFASRSDPGTTDEWNQWSEQGLPGQPGVDEPYAAALQAFTWLLSTPGTPMMYAGDEYGEYGGADPDNRHMWRDDGARNARERALAESVGALGRLRSDLEPLRRGEYSSLHNSTDAIAWSMATADAAAVVAMNRAATSHSFSLDLASLPGDWSGAVEARFGNATMQDGALTLPAHSVAILAFPDETNNGSGDGEGNASVPNSPPDTDCAPLDLNVTATPDDYGELADHLPKSVSVFGVHLLAASNIPAADLQHAASVMAGYLDSDADGTPDDATVVAEMVSRKATMVIPLTPDDMETIFEALPESFHQRVDAGEFAFQDLYGIEIHPSGRGGAQAFDATLEEVLHLITNVGYANAYPNQFAEVTGSDLTIAMNQARGGHYEESEPGDCEDEQGPCALPQNGYPESAWYHYEDGTCDYACMATEYLYWALTTYLGAQGNPNRCTHIADEWELCTREELAATDPAVVSLIENSTLPSRLPSGTFCPPDPSNGTEAGNHTDNQTGNGTLDGNGTGNGSGNQTGNGTGDGIGNGTDNSSASATVPSESAPVPKVLIIGIDGVRSDVALASAERNGSALGQIASEGAWSYESTVGPIALSGPSWSSMLTGVWCDRHGVTDNSFDGSLHSSVPDIFEWSEAHNPGLDTASYVYWAKIEEQILGPDAADLHNNSDGDADPDQRDAWVHERGLAALQNPDLDLLFIQYGLVDRTGHDYGFSPDVPEYISALERTDDRAAEILAALDARNTSDEDWLIIIASDHGGGGARIKAHSPSTLVDRTTFLMVAGGATVPGELEGSVVVDVAVTALTHLKVPLPSGDDELDGRALAFDPDAPVARTPNCEMPTTFASVSNLTYATIGLGVILAAAVSVLATLRLKRRGVGRAIETIDHGSNEIDLVPIDDSLPRSEEISSIEPIPESASLPDSGDLAATSPSTADEGVDEPTEDASKNPFDDVEWPD